MYALTVLRIQECVSYDSNYLYSLIIYLYILQAFYTCTIVSQDLDFYATLVFLYQ